MTRPGLLVLVLTLALPAHAVGQEDGVTLDPDSPTGKEYAIPLDEARKDVAPGTRADGDAPPLFGEGVTPPPKSAGDAKAGGADRDRDRRGGRDDSSPGDEAAAGGGGGAAPPAESGAPANAATTPEGGGAELALIGGGALGAILLGAAGGLVARRRLSPG